MKIILLLLSLLLSTYLSAAELKELDLSKKSLPWRLERVNFYFENDFFSNADAKYTSGAKLSAVYFIPEADSVFEEIPFINDKSKAHFVSMGIAQQIFTPINTNESELVQNERPYAGWLYFEYGVHESTGSELDSLTIQVGVVGEYSGAEATQKAIHSLRKIDSPNGWDNQLNNELGINLNYQHKWRFVPKKVYGVESNFIPFVEGSLGNIRTELKVGTLMRFGWNPIEDFGSSSIDIGGENGIPIQNSCLCPRYEQWSFTFNVTLAGKAVARNIFLDGNTFSRSHSISKEAFVGYTSLGLSMRYKYYAFDYISTDFTKQFSVEQGDRKYGSLLFSYVY